MALIQIRVRPNSSTRVTMGNSGKLAGGFADSLKELCLKVDGLEFSGFFVSMANSEGVVMLDGDPNKLSVVYQVLNWSGAFEYVKCEILTPAEEISENRPLAEQLAPSFNAPNRDEIDRILLDE